MNTDFDRSGRRQKTCACPPGQCECFKRDKKIKVDIISGFLGAGKTTLMNNLLSQEKGELDVLVREYGEAAIDDKLLKGVPEERLHVFFGVSMHDHPQLLLHDYLHRIAAEDTEGKMTHLLIETSGLDYPEDIVELFMVGYIPMSYELGSFTAVADAQFGNLTLDEYRVAVEQAAYADRIVVNKTDLASAAEVGKLCKRLREINGVARIIITDHGRVEADKLMGGSLYGQLKDLKKTEGSKAMDGITTLVISEQRPLDKEKVNAWIDDLYQTHGDEILRGKGFLDFAGEDYRYEFQSVRRAFHSASGEKWRLGEERKSTLVFIGRDSLISLNLQQGLSACAV